MRRLVVAGLAGVAFLFAGPSVPAGAARAGATETVLYNFGGPDGAGPLRGLIAGSAAGAYFGTTVFGGTYGQGVAYELTIGAKGATERVIHDFGHRGEGDKPDGVVAGTNGTLYGVTAIGGADGQGAVFELERSGTHYNETTIYTFTGGPDGGQPLGPLAIDGTGHLSGITQFGGFGSYGTIFELSPAKAGFRYRVLHDFSLPAQAQAGVTTGPAGVLYGTTYSGGTGSCSCGTVYALDPGAAGYRFHTLYNFQGGRDGSNPFAALTVDASTGTIYGTTEYGGGYGTVFSLTPAPHGYKEQILKRFASGAGGFLPQSPLTLLPGGSLVGTTGIGGGRCSGTGYGVVFELTPSDTGYSYLLYHFLGPPNDGAEPEWTTLVAGPDGVLLGATRSGGDVATCADGGPGGVSGCGTIFALSLQA